MKYINVDLLRAVIKEHTLFYAGQANLLDGTNALDGYDEVLAIIDSLQQEQPDFPTTDEQMKEFLATHPKIEVPEKYKNPDWLFKKQEQPDVFDTAAFQRGVQEGRRLERENVKSTIQSRIDGILGDAQPKPALRAELQELIKKIEA